MATLAWRLVAPFDSSFHHAASTPLGPRAQGAAAGCMSTGPGPATPEEEAELGGEDALELPFDDDPTGAVDDGDLGDFDDTDVVGPFDEDGDPLDDATADDLETGAILDDLGEESPALDDDAQLDVGPLDDGMMFDDGAGFDEDDSGFATDEDDADFSDAREADDGGAEGTNESPEGEVDEGALPALDDGEDERDRDEDDESLTEESLSVFEGALPAWDTTRWTAIEGTGAEVPCQALSVDSGRVIAAGEVLLIVDEGARAARRATFGAGSTAVAASEDLMLVAVPRGQLQLSRDGGQEVATLSGWRAAKGPVELAATPGRLWILADGALYSLSAASNPPLQVRERGVVRVVASRGALVALSQSPAGMTLERLRSDDEGWQATPLRGAARRLAQAAASAGSALLSATGGGRAVALGDGSEVLLSRDGGATFSSFAFGPTRALAFAGDDADAALLVLVAPLPEAEATLVQVPARGEPTSVASLPAPFEGPMAMAWDASREVLWVASRAGLGALGRARRH